MRMDTPKTDQRLLEIMLFFRTALGLVRAQNRFVTDDAAACELIDQPVKLVETLEANPKVTVPADLSWIELLLTRSVHSRKF